MDFVEFPNNYIQLVASAADIAILGREQASTANMKSAAQQLGTAPQ